MLTIRIVAVCDVTLADEFVQLQLVVRCAVEKAQRPNVNRKLAQKSTTTPSRSGSHYLSPAHATWDDARCPGPRLEPRAPAQQTSQASDRNSRMRLLPTLSPPWKQIPTSIAGRTRDVHTDFIFPTVETRGKEKEEEPPPPPTPGIRKRERRKKK